jgi:hypothetical protein
MECGDLSPLLSNQMHYIEMEGRIRQSTGLVQQVARRGDVAALHPKLADKPAPSVLEEFGVPGSRYTGIPYA